MNEKLLQLGRQFAGIWRELGINQRISIVAAAVIVLAFLVSLGFWSGRADYTLLYGRLDDAEAGKVTAVLDDAKVPYRVGPGAGSIYVPTDKVHLMRMQLASRGVPRSDGVGFEIFDKPNFGISDFVQRANYLRAIQGELARTISQLDEVESARVMIVQPENRLLMDNIKRPTASVFVRVRKELSPQSINSIRFIVANSVEGLVPGQVTVVDNRGQVLSENTDGDSMVGLTSTQLAARRNIEQYMAKKAQGMLDAVLGPGHAVVRVAVDLNFDTSSFTEERYDPESQVVRISTVNDESTETAGPEEGGVAGVVPNIAAEPNVPAAAANNNRVRKKVLNNQYEINRSVSNVTQVAGAVRRLSAAVFVASRYEGTGVARKVTPRTPEELEKLRRIVQSALGVQSNSPGINQDQITLEEMPFTEQFTDLGPELTRQEKKQFWYTQVQNLIYPVLALIIFFVFWRMMKKTPLDNISVGFVVSESSRAPHAPDKVLRAAHGSSSAHGRGSSPTGMISVETFNQLVRDNPANLTQAIQNWLDQSKPNRN